MKSKTLPSIRVKKETSENIKRAILKYNSNSIQQLSEQEFRRLSYEILSQLILTDQIIPAKLTTK